MASAGWQFWIDRGGTFTDIVAQSPDGDLVTHKLLSSHPEAYADAALQGMRDVLGLEATEAIKPVAFVRMGTTVATNALLERKGEPVLLAITQGFADALKIAYQNRPDLFVRQICRAEPLYDSVIEIPARMDENGTEIRPLDTRILRGRLQCAFEAGFRSIAISCLHGYRNPDHEQQALRLAAEVGFEQIAAGHQVSQLWKLIPRSDTTVVESYLAPGLRRYVDSVASALPDMPLQFMQSSGGLIDAHRFHARNAILSGPAGGIVGAVKAAQEAGVQKVLTFDMGGTSTDVAHYAGRFERSLESEVAGVRLRSAMLHIHTVAAGGGSVCRFNQGRLQVGPASAGADPGPAAYGRGGPVTITDCNVLLGRIRPDRFPAVFGPGRDQPLSRAATLAAFKRLAKTISKQTGQIMAVEDIALGCLEIAVQSMANAIKKISVQRGYDPRGYTLVTFGGAGGQHACQVAASLGITQVLLHPMAGVLSAYGIGMADVSILKQATVGCALDDKNEQQLDRVVREVSKNAETELAQQSTAGPARSLTLRVRVRYAGSDAGLLVDLADFQTMHDAFEDAHRTRFGFVQADRTLVIDSVEAEASAHNPRNRVGKVSSAGVQSAGKADETDSSLPLWHVDDLCAAGIEGPAVIVEPHSTIFVDLGWTAARHRKGAILLTCRDDKPPVSAGCDLDQPVGRDPVLLEIFNNLFMSIAEQMGYALQATAHSVNIKERLDFSCGIFDSAGQLVANAPHMPVHLGSMGESVVAVLARWCGKIKPGDAYVLNAPYGGGTHLPDITVVTPLFINSGPDPDFFLASRGHHADVGGITPGSMPADSNHIDQEGVLFDGEKIVEDGEFLERAMERRLRSGPYPARNSAQNIADLKAQVAANHKGARELAGLSRQYGFHTLKAYMGFVQDNAAEAVTQALGRLRSGSFTLPMDGGAQIQVQITLNASHTHATVDFSGTSLQRRDNYNAPRAVCRACVLYVFRTLVDEDIPMNEGCLRPIDLVVPSGTLLNPVHPAAVVAGNVETSQCVVDALYGALGVMAGAQGTMNNTTFGNEDHQYYETVCGGAGAGPSYDGADAIQTHMTNSRLTDPEVLESRFPVRLKRFEIRAGSGGHGSHRGGHGVRRELTFLQPMTLSFLSSRRRFAPDGLLGGGAGQTGRQWIEHADGRRSPLRFRDQRLVNPGDTFVLETPGGGGCGKPGQRS